MREYVRFTATEDTGHTDGIEQKWYNWKVQKYTAMTLQRPCVPKAKCAFNQYCYEVMAKNDYLQLFTLFLAAAAAAAAATAATAAAVVRLSWILAQLILDM